jgi:hypothetical protein
VSITFTCECGRTIKASGSAAGKRTRCPGCGDLVMVPKVSAPKVVAPIKVGPLPLPRFRLRSLLIAVALAAVSFAGFRRIPYDPDVVYGAVLPLAFLVITSYALVKFGRRRRMSLWSIVLLVIGFIALALAAFWLYALYQLGRVAV